MSDTTIIVLAVFAGLIYLKERHDDRRQGTLDGAARAIPKLKADFEALSLRQDELYDAVQRWTKRDTMRERRAGGADDGSDIPRDLIERCGGDVARARRLYERKMKARATEARA